MVKFYNEDLKKNLVKCVEYIISTSGKNTIHIYSEDLELDNYSIEEDLEYFESLKCLGEEYSEDEINDLELGDEEEIIINDNSEIEIYFYDYDYDRIELTVGELIDYIGKYKSSSFDDKGVCISDKKVIFRVCPHDIYYDNTCYFPKFHKSVKYNDKNLEINISPQNAFYSLMLYFEDSIDEYNPAISPDDLFIEISSDEKLGLESKSIYEIYNSYVFEIFASYNIKLDLNPRIIMNYYDEGLEGAFDDDNPKLRPLLFGKGLKDVIALFNNAEGHGIDDRSIIEYIKVIEYVSQTVIRMEITEEARKKLNSEEALKPNANYIKELENMFIDYNNKYNTDRNSIKATILKCCDIKQLTKYSPRFLKKLSDLDEKFANPKSNKSELLKNAYDELCSSISDTRNDLSHAKANYSPNGYECPNDEKKDFVVLLRHICVQVIRWFSNVSEIDRIININEEK